MECIISRIWHSLLKSRLRASVTRYTHRNSARSISKHFQPPAMTPYTPTEDPATYMETLCNSWDGTLGDQGYTNIITEDLETLETKKRIAMEVAAGFYRL